MKTLTLISVIILALGSTNALAHKDRHVWARVVEAEPVYRWVNVSVPERQCWMETVATEVPSSNRVASTVVGGLIGHAVGRAAGHSGRSRDAGGAIGAVVGMAIGSEASRSRGHHSRIEYHQVEQCEVRHTQRRERELVGYDVVYRLDGKLHRTRTMNNPGRRIEVSTRGHRHHDRHGH